ncbi:MAG: T9SS type A sorting domain-containing protein [Bacteroidota bacterium]
MKKIFTLLFIAGILGVSAQDVNVTIRVNMELETTSMDGVFVAGGADFGNPGDNPMADPDGDDVWEITFVLPQGYTGNYTFTNGACPDYSCKENIVGLPCADGPFSDRLLSNIQSDTTINTCFSQCSTDGMCTPPLAPVNVTFHVDMSEETVLGPVYITGGTVDGWCGSCTPLDDPDGDGIYTGTIELAQGAHEYKFTNNGWAPDGVDEVFDPMTADSTCTLTSGGFTNRFLFIDGADDIEMDVVCFNSCSPCMGMPIDPVPVVFQVDMSLETVLGPIYITGGSIDGWCGSCTELTNVPGTNIYRDTLMMDPGAHEYKFTNNGWPADGVDEVFDPTTADSTCTLTTDGFTNRLIMVPEGSGMIVTDAFCFASCETCPVGIAELTERQFTLNPSITDAVTTISFNEVLNENRILRVYSTSGVLVEQVMIKANEQQYILDVSAYAEGLYILNIESNGIDVTKKLVVSK